MIVLHGARFIVIATLVLAACGGERQARDAAEPPDSGAEPGSGMEGMEGMSAGMMSSMMAHLQTMDGLAGDSIQAMMPMHRQMAANMIAQMNREMREMNMAPDARWNAMVDSLRQDLTGMPEMSAGELETMMPGHHARMMRLMQMHEAMMSNMQM